jgi:hypothetical protein
MGWEGVDDSSGSISGSYEYANEPSGFMKGGIFFYQLSDYEFYKKDSTPRSLFVN